MIEILDSQEKSRVTGLSLDVSKFYEEYKSRIEQIIYHNYGLKKEDELLLLFKELGIVLSDRNNELLVFLEGKYGLNFKQDFDFSGGIKLDISLLDDNISERIKSFFNKGYTRKEESYIHSRGYGYYFNFPGLDYTGNNYNLNIPEYLQHLSKYYNDILEYLLEFKGKKISTLEASEKKLLLIGLEHYKNILLFLQNFIISVSDREYLNKHVLNISSKTFDNFFTDVSQEQDFLELNNLLKSELERVITDFSDVTLGINSETEVDYHEQEFIGKIMGTIDNLYSGSFQKQKEFLDKLGDRKKSGRETDYNSINKSISKSNNKLIGKLLRIIREEDNPIKQLFACHNIANNIPQDTKLIDAVGVLYGGIEMPYFMKYVLTRLLEKEPNDIDIKLLGLSAYSNRNLKQTSVLSNYIPINGYSNSNAGARLQVVLDDNLHYGNSLQVASNISASKGPVYSGVTEIGLRTKSIGKLEGGTNINYILSKIPDSASVTPIEKNRGSYRNLINRYILKKLPGLVGKL